MWIEKKGTDDLYRNAKLLKKVIELVNADKVAVNGVIQDNVIIGQSMGGVITRIALKEMENASEDHQTRLFISQDSPQQGANVSIAYQYMGRHFRNIYISTGVVALGVELVQLIRGGVSPLKALSLSNEPASKQMLINYISDFGTLRNVHHDDFYASLRTLGYPQGTSGHPFRMVAMSNGSECANSQGFNPGASLLAIDGKIQTRFLGDVAFSALSTFISPIFPFSRIFKFGSLPGRNELRTTLNLNAIANGGGNEVYYCDISYRKKLFYLVNINVTLAHKEKDADSGMIPIDGYPGGFYPLPINLQSSSATNWFYKYSITASMQNSFNFIPTTSSLDIGGGATTLNSSDFLRVYSASTPPASPKQTPFANFIVARQNNIASVNEDHISFTARNADWAGNEITTNLNSTTPPLVDCSYICNGVLQIQGSAQFCSGPETYTIPNLPAGATVTWSVSPSIGRVSLTTSGNTAILTRTGNGYVQLSATVNNAACGNVNIQPINIFVGIPQITAINLSTTTTSGYWCANARGNKYEIVLEPGQSPIGVTFQIQLLDPVTYQVFANYTVTGGRGTFALSRPPNTTYLLQARIINHPCGTSEIWFGYEMEFIDCTNNYRVSNYNVYPNPAGNDLNIEYTAQEDKTSEKLRITNNNKDIKLFNDKGEIMLSSIMKENESKLVLDTSKIPDGTYYLHITEGKETIKKQIIIKH